MHEKANFSKWQVDWPQLEDSVFSFNIFNLVYLGLVGGIWQVTRSLGKYNLNITGPGGELPKLLIHFKIILIIT